ncbi:non-specific lipid transfer protein GPI-anchored 5 [Nicotiana tabacum]|uniref:Non-specific lipid transfer protein GPI-anchored 5 n=1 Tax=Nicotiana tabacum TaxID=4097 RepID=A0AC58TTN0_TOBAC|nr:non-specific lipid-transfer protein-like protein At2g13820 isoform X1 [Nicotiana tomentosiformis]
MASQRNEMGATLVVLAMIWVGVTAQESDDCTNVLVSMLPCMNYITGNSSPQFSGCCTQLSTVVDKKPECLCQVLNGGDSNINQTQASALTTACKVQTPPASRCNAGGSNSVPSSQGGSNDATSTNMAAPLSLCFLFIASYASIINMA